MANTTISPNMNLVIPTVGQEPGPNWANDINASLTTIDQHNHSTGQGVQINPSGLNINTDLSFASNNATNLRSSRYTVQTMPLSGANDLGCAYCSGVDYYFNDLNGNQIQITKNGAVAGTPGSIANLASPASASFVSANGTFLWQSAANTPGNLDAGYLILRNNSVNSKGLTLYPPSAMGANFSITLPTLPASQSFVTIDQSGNLAAPVVYPLVAAGIATGTITTTQIANTTITQGNMALRSTGSSTEGAGGVAISSSCGEFFVDTGGNHAITNFSVTITSLGNPVEIWLQPDGSTSVGGLIGAYANGGSNGFVQYLLFRGASQISLYVLQVLGPTAATGYYIPSSSMRFMDIVGAGTYTYTIQMNVDDAYGYCFNSVLCAREIK